MAVRASSLNLLSRLAAISTARWLDEDSTKYFVIYQIDRAHYNSMKNDYRKTFHRNIFSVYVL